MPTMGRVVLATRLGWKARPHLLNGEFDNVQRQRIRLERKVALLRPESLDPDMLDEMARSQLEVAAPNELVTFQKP